MKKKPNTYTRAGRSNVTLKNFLNNLKENDIHFENSQITQCVFLGVLRLKPVPSMFCSSSAISTDSLLEVKNTSDNIRRMRNNSTQELNKSSSRKSDINKVISGRISKKNTIKVKQSVKKVPTKQTILKVNFKMNKKPEIPSTASGLANSTIILSDTKIIPQCASFSKSPMGDQTKTNPVQNLFDKLKQQMDERNHQQENSTGYLLSKKVKGKGGKKKSSQERLPMPLQTGSPNIEIDSDSSGFKDDGIHCSSSDTNSISPLSQNSIEDPPTGVSSKDIICIEDAQNSDVIILDSPKILRVSPRIKKVDEAKQTDMKELKISVPINDDNNDDTPSTLLQTFIQSSDSDKPKKRRRLMPTAMPSIFFNTPMLLRSELAQKRGGLVEHRAATKTTPRLVRTEGKQKKEQSLEKTPKSEGVLKNNDNLIYEVVKSSNILEAACSSAKEVIVIDDMPPKVEPLILKRKVSPQKASTSKEPEIVQVPVQGDTFSSERINKMEIEEELDSTVNVSSGTDIEKAKVSPSKQVSVEQIQVVKNSPKLSKPVENLGQCIIIEDDIKSVEISKKEENADDIIIVVDEDNTKLTSSEFATQHKVSVIKESVLKSPQNYSVAEKVPDPVVLVEENVSSNLVKEDSNIAIQEQEVILIDPIDVHTEKSCCKNSKKSSSLGQNTEEKTLDRAPDVSKPDAEPPKGKLELAHESAQEVFPNIKSPIKKSNKPEAFHGTNAVDVDAEEDAIIVESKISLSETLTESKTTLSISDANLDNDMGKSPTSITKAHEIFMPLLATSRVLRSEKSQQKSTEQAGKESAVKPATIDNTTSMKEENLDNVANQEVECESVCSEKSVALQRSEESQTKPPDQSDKSVEATVVSRPEKTQENNSDQTNKSLAIEEVRKFEYINPPEATSRVLRSEKSQQKTPESNMVYIIPPGATARVLRSEKIQFKAEENCKTTGTENKSNVQDAKTRRGSKRSLCASNTSFRSDSPSTSKNNEEVPKCKNKSTKIAEVKLVKRSREVKPTSQKSEQEVRKSTEATVKKRRGSSSASNGAGETCDILPKHKIRALKKHEKNKSVMKRVLRSSEIKHLQPGLEADIVKTKTKAQKKPLKSPNKRGQSAKTKNESGVSKSRMNKLRKIVSLKTKKIAEGKKMVNWRNNEIIEEIIRELKNTIFKSEPENNASRLGGEEKESTVMENKSKVRTVTRRITRFQRKDLKSKGKQTNNSTKNTRGTNTRMNKQVFKGSQVLKDKKSRTLPKNLKEETVKKPMRKMPQVIAPTIVPEENCGEPEKESKIPTRRTGGRRKMKVETPEVIQENSVTAEVKVSVPKSRKSKGGCRKSLRKINANEKITEENNVEEEIEQQSKTIEEHVSIQEELSTPVEVDGTALIIEVDGTLNEKKREEIQLPEENVAEAKQEESSQSEGKNKISAKGKRKIKVVQTNANVSEKPPTRKETSEPTKEEPSVFSSLLQPRVETQETTSIPPFASSTPPTMKKKNDESKQSGNVKKQAPKKYSIIVHDDVVLPEGKSRNTVEAVATKQPDRPARGPDSDAADRKGDIAIFDFEENEPEVGPLRHKNIVDRSPEKDGAGSRLEAKTKKPKVLWSRINTDVPRRKKKLWTVVENPARRRCDKEEKPAAAESDEDEFVKIVRRPPPVKREPWAGRPAPGGGGAPEEAESDQPAETNASPSSSPIKSESPMKQLTITEMFSKFLKKTEPPSRPVLDDCEPKQMVQQRSPESIPKDPTPETNIPIHPDRSEDNNEANPVGYMPPPSKTETRRYSRIDNADDDDSDCESRAEWVPEEYAEYKFKYSAQKMMQVKQIYKCKVCLVVLPSYYRLVQHKKCHVNVDNPYSCKQCGAHFSNVEDYSAHLRVHKGKHPYQCLKCSMGFWTKEAYEEHAPVHVLRKQKPSVKRFRCDICAKEFSKLCDVERHTRVHTGEKPCVCNICNKGFQQSHNLSKHLLTHLHIKPFQCDICNRQFGRNDVLNRHLLTHSVEKPIKCWVCSKGFIRHTQLVVHLMKYHPDRLLEDPNQRPEEPQGEEEEDEEEQGGKTEVGRDK